MNKILCEIGEYAMSDTKTVALSMIVTHVVLALLGTDFFIIATIQIATGMLYVKASKVKLATTRRNNEETFRKLMKDRIVEAYDE